MTAQADPAGRAVMSRRALLRVLAFAPAAARLSPRLRRHRYQATYPRTY